ncbi:MAG: Tfp pilus assembly protein FimT/FimU [Nodosilinea sp.]
MPKLLQRPARSPVSHAQNLGFTLLEGLVVVVIIALLAMIVAPGFLGFLEQRKINATRSSIYQALRATQRDAGQNRQTQQFSLREQDGYLEWANHPETISPAQVTLWMPLTEGVLLADEDNTLLNKSGVYYVRFNFQGDVQSQLGTITITGSGGRLTHRCIIVSTLIGALRQGEGHLKKNGNGRYCY